MNIQELIEAARKAIADGDLEKAEKLTAKVKALKALADLEPEPAQDDSDELAEVRAELKALREFKERIENEPAQKAAGHVVVTEDETDKKAAKPFPSFGEQMKAVANAAIRPHMMDERLKAQKAVLGQNEGTPSDGGFLVQTDFAAEIFRIMHDTGTVANRCRPWPISSNANGTKINGIDETSRADGSRWGGVQAYWVAEGGTITATQMKFRQIELNLKKLAALVYATDEILQDTTQLTTLMSTAVPEEMNFVLDDSIINGSGAGKPLGYMNANSLVTVAKESGQAAATIVVQNIFKLWSRMHARSRMNAVWLINQDIEPQLLALDMPTGGNGVPVYLPPGGLSQSPYGQLLGRPMIPIEQAATLGTVGDISLVDLTQYALATKVNAGIQQAQSIHVQFLTDQTAFRFIFRVDGQPLWHSALTPKNGSATQSPFITLATRS